LLGETHSNIRSKLSLIAYSVVELRYYKTKQYVGWPDIRPLASLQR